MINDNKNTKSNTQLKLKPKIIFIIGIGRSGTSLLANCLVENGLSIGKSINKDKNWQNPNGYFENNVFTKIHNKLLTFNNCSWHTITKEKMKYTSQHIQQYRRLLKTEFINEKFILIKDPRLTFFVDFLKNVCSNDYEYKFLFLTRNKEECCLSLNKAQKVPIEKCKILYDTTMSKYHKEFLMINHNDIITKNNYILKLIGKHCGIKLDTDTNYLVNMKLYRNRK